MVQESINAQIEEVSIEQGELQQGVRVGKSLDGLSGRFSHEVFKYDCLDRKLKRHHVTGKYALVVPKHCSLTLDRNRFLGCGWHRSLSDFGRDNRIRRSYWCFTRILVRWSYYFCGYAIARGDGQCKTGFWGDHGLS